MGDCSALVHVEARVQVANIEQEDGTWKTQHTNRHERMFTIKRPSNKATEAESEAEAESA